MKDYEISNLIVVLFWFCSHETRLLTFHWVGRQFQSLFKNLFITHVIELTVLN